MSKLKDKMTPENVNENSCITEHDTPEDTVQGSEDWDRTVWINRKVSMPFLVIYFPFLNVDPFYLFGTDQRI